MGTAFAKKRLLYVCILIIMVTITGCENNKTANKTDSGKNVSDKDASESTAHDTDKKVSKDTGDAENSESYVAPEIERNSDILDFSKESGVYADSFSLEIKSGNAGEIYYTIDGSDPATSETRMLYSGPFSVSDRSKETNYVSAVDPGLFDGANVTINSTKDGFDNTLQAPPDENVDKCTVIRAAAKSSDGKYSETGTATYFIGDMTDHIQGLKASCEAAGTSLAVISISINYEDMFNSAYGIYVKGDIFKKALEDYIASGEKLTKDTARSLEANYSQRGSEWERRAHIDFMESDGTTTTCQFSQDCGIRIQGNYSRSDLQKGFRLYADEEYGAKNFEYTVFGDGLKDDAGETISKFKTLTLRAGGNCAFTTKYSDTYWQSLIKDLDCETQTSRPCVVYVDGEYWGLYVLQEDYTDNYFEIKHGVNNKDVVLYKGDAETYEIGYKLDIGDLPDGVSDESYYFKDLLDFFSTHKDLTSDADYTEFVKLVDVQSAMDYFATEIWINNKWDWPGKNWSLWKTVKVDESNPYADGKWRFCFYDVEFGGVSGSSDATTNTIKEDNYKTYGLLDMDTKNPVVLIYAYLMTNPEFRNAFEAELLNLSQTNFEKTAAQTALGNFRNIYSPLYNQFFDRYPGSGSSNDAINGGYASYKCINDFLNHRAENIQTMIDYVEKHYAK